MNTNNFISHPNDYTQVSTNSDHSANSYTLDFKVNFSQKAKPDSPISSDVQREIFADQKPKEQILKEFNQMRQEKIKTERNKKRQNFISRKRQLIQQKSGAIGQIESDENGPMEMINYEAERQAHLQSNTIVINQMEMSKSEIFIMCHKIKNGQNESEQVDGIHQLNQFLVRREKNEK